MSQYVNSFLIDPVIRQARRFSRSNIDSKPQSIEELSLQNGRVRSRHSLLASTLETDHLLDLSQDPILHGDEISLSPVSEEHGPEPPQAQYGLIGSSEEWNGDALRIGTGGSTPVPGRDSPGEGASSGDPLRSTRQRFLSSNHSFTGSIPDAFSISADTPRQSRRNTGHEDVSPARQMDGILPEDDGMGIMRKQIIDIHRMEASIYEKARLIHQLMTAQYNLSQPSLHSPHLGRPRSLASMRSQERPFTPSSGHSVGGTLQPAFSHTSLSSAAEGEHACQVCTEDLQPTFYTKVVPRGIDGSFDSNPDVLGSEEEERSLGCAHYKRNVKMQCSACGRWYTCRFCHDEVEDHSLNRRETKNMMCMLCGSPQPASEVCRDCGESAAYYYCDVCKLWDNDTSRNIYHCDDCGICRVGQGLGKDFYHCKICSVCLAISIRDTHRCMERITDCDCPICGEYMFNSPQTVVCMPCGHTIHQTCYKEHIQNSYKCPICSRSVVNMEMQFGRLTRSIESQPMPPEFHDTKALVYCNDCRAKTLVKYHWLGLKCDVCDSYNTAQVRILREPEPDAEIEIEASVPPDPDDINLVLSETIQPILRGRSLTANDLHRRLTSSASAVDTSHATLPPAARGTRSTSATAMARIAFPDSATESDSDLVETDGDDDDDAVDFWGGESPSNRAIQAIQNTQERIEGDDSEDDEDEDEGDDDDGDLMTDEPDDDDDDEADHMEIFGHR